MQLERVLPTCAADLQGLEDGPQICKIINSINDQFDQIAANMQNIRRVIQELRSEGRNVSSSLQDNQRDLEQVRTEAQSLRAQLAQYQAYGDVQAVQQAQERLQKLQQEWNELQRERATLQETGTQNTELIARLQAELERYRRLKPALTSIQNNLQAVNGGMTQSLAVEPAQAQPQPAQEGGINADMTLANNLNNLFAQAATTMPVDDIVARVSQVYNQPMTVEGLMALPDGEKQGMVADLLQRANYNPQFGQREWTPAELQELIGLVSQYPLRSRPLPRMMALLNLFYRDFTRDQLMRMTEQQRQDMLNRLGVLAAQAQ